MLRTIALLSSVFGAGAAGAVDLAGRYAIEGSNPDGSRYSGELLIRPQGNTWAVEWRLPASVTGIGISDGNTLVVGYGGSDCGVVAWDIGNDRSLDGQWAQNGEIGRESATPMAAGRGLAGRYTVAGSNPNGSPYRGTLDLRADAGGYALDWRTGSNYRGTGLEHAGILAASWGEDCGVVVYRIANGGMDGVWRTPNGPVGRERLSRRR